MVEAGNHLVAIPTEGGKYTAVVAVPVVAGDHVVSVPVGTNGVGIKVNPVVAGNKIVCVPDALGKYIALKAIGGETPIVLKSWAMCYLGGGIVLISSFTGSKLYRSIDYGIHWTEYDLSASLNTRSIWTMLNLGGGVVLAATDSVASDDGKRMAVFKSTDYGITWSLMWQSTFIEDPPYGYPFLHAISLLSNGSNIYLTTRTNLALLYKSTNTGVSWSLKGYFGRGTANLAIDEDTGYLTVGLDNLMTGFGDVYRSEDEADTWAAVKRFGYDHPSNPVLDTYAAINSCVTVDGIFVPAVKFWNSAWTYGDVCIYQGEDYGAGAYTQRASIDVHPYRMRQMFLVPGTTNIVGFVESSGIYNSPDSGVTWTIRLVNTDAMTQGAAFCYMADDGVGTFLFTIAGKLYKSIDAGISWTLVSTYAA
jgi:photosystem II stability/assembly factor-like uncharacterized protein